MMAKTRLLVSAKDSLRQFARQNVAASKEQKALDATYKKAAKLLMPIIEKQFPKADMELLDRYKVARRDTCIRCVNENGRVVQFNFTSDDAPLLPARYHSSRNFMVTKTCLTAIDDWLLKKDACKKAEQEILSQYFALIEATRYAEEILEIWPAAEPALASYVKLRKQKLPVAVSPDTIAFIRKNNAGAQLEATG
jgi:NADPH:quinone reductase-like Zn-dependent oxidoreductase